MLLFPKSQYISEQAGAPDILSPHPIFSSSWSNPLISSSHSFRYVYNLNERTLQQYKGTRLQTLLTPGMQHQVSRILLALSTHSSPGETPSVPQFLGFRAFRGASLSLRLTERGVSGIIGLDGPCGPGVTCNEKVLFTTSDSGVGWPVAFRQFRLGLVRPIQW